MQRGVSYSITDLKETWENNGDFWFGVEIMQSLTVLIL